MRSTKNILDSMPGNRKFTRHSMKQMAASEALVRRNGEWISIPARDLVTGDVLRLNTGDIV